MQLKIKLSKFDIFDVATFLELFIIKSEFLELGLAVCLKSHLGTFTIQLKCNRFFGFYLISAHCIQSYVLCAVENHVFKDKVDYLTMSILKKTTVNGHHNGVILPS